MHRLIQFAAVGIVAMTTSAVSANADQVPFQVGEVVILGAMGDLSGFTIKKHFPQAAITVVNVASGGEQGAIDTLMRRGVRAYRNRIASKFTTNDPFSVYQWHFDSVQAPQAWAISSGAGVTVAVLDTGINLAGPDGIHCATGAADMVGGATGVLDKDGHGTHVSGTIAQKTDNGVGVAGLAHGSCIMPVKVLDDTGSGTFADIAAGLHYAVDQGAKVINMSLGVNARFGLTNDPVLDPALEYAYQNGVTVVAAAGNDGFRKNVSYPAIYPTTIAVGATGFSNTLASYSNYGKGLDLVAPGGIINADQNGDGYGDGVLQETFDSNDVFGYWFYQGTSMATPHVSAIAALLIAHGNATTPDQIRAALQETAMDLGADGRDAKYGYGLAQAFDALNWTAGSPPPSGGTCTDNDNDGVCWEDGDCDDNDPEIYPGFNEKGRRKLDGKDNDCNGVVDG